MLPGQVKNKLDIRLATHTAITDSGYRHANESYLHNGPVLQSRRADMVNSGVNRFL